MTDILGMWNETAAALNQDGSTLYDWEAQFRIDPDGDSVRVTVATERSQSRSISSNATVQPMPDGRVALLYDYIADPTHEGTESHDFFGMTRILFDADGQRGEGHYFNYNGRYTYGRLTLTRR